MRILIVHTHAAVIGGVESYLETLMPELIRRGHELALLYESPVAKGSAILCHGAAAYSMFCTGSIGTAAALAAALDWEPDVFFAHSVVDPHLEAALLKRLPSAIFVHDYQRTCPTGTMSHARPAISVCRRAAGPACLLMHYPRRCGGLSPLTMIRRYRAQQESAALLKQYSAVIVASQWMRSNVAANGVAVAGIAVLAPPGGAGACAPPPSWRTPSGQILFIGRLLPVKGCAVLIDALAILREQDSFPLALTVAGRGPEESSLCEQARRRRVPVEFSGWADAAARDRLLGEADLVVVPSIWPEPYGMVGREAAAFGVPSVAFDTGGIRDWLRPGTSGELAPADPPSAEGLASAIFRALGDAAHFNALRRGAWEQALTGDVRTHAERLERILESAAAAQRTARV